ncbi:MAG: DUF4276 family protein [Candidatus Hinthialibacter antarcticus]|nr:DUF4276 family protein [Candidatus Hinthialibacter antarcticus]
MKTLVFFLEEPSAKEMLKGVLPKVIPEGIYPDFKIFEGKQDLEKNLGKILRAWNTPDCVFMILQDQDSGDCKIIKETLFQICDNATNSPVMVRIACRELESFYLGDLEAVEKGLKIPGLSQKQNKEKFRHPDRLGTPSMELSNLTKGAYQKVSGSRAIAPHLDLNNNKSLSFKMLINGVKKLIDF